MTVRPFRWLKTFANVTRDESSLSFFVINALFMKATQTSYPRDQINILLLENISNTAVAEL